LLALASTGHGHASPDVIRILVDPKAEYFIILPLLLRRTVYYSRFGIASYLLVPCTMMAANELESVPPALFKETFSHIPTSSVDFSDDIDEFDDSRLPPVDGGYQAWLFLAACFMVEGIVWGESFNHPDQAAEVDG
jgi:hypothetical protein